MVMVFTLVSAVQEKLGEMVEAVRSERRREKERKEEEEKRKEEVTVCVFIMLYKLQDKGLFLFAHVRFIL